MDSHAYLVVLLVCSIIVFHDIEVEGGRWNISSEEDLVFEKQLKLLNKPAIKSIHTDYGDIYDCVDFYKQPAFDHPLLKNYRVDNNQIKASIFTRKHLDVVSRNESEYINLELKDGGCPKGTVPIRRITKEDLIRQSIAAEVRPLLGDDVAGTHYAVVRTKAGVKKIVGAGGAPSIYEPQVTDQQYSAARIKLNNGVDSIELGWRVDPRVYGDAKSRLYILIDAGLTYCFDTRCPGFVVIDRSIPLGGPIDASNRGGPITTLQFYITRDMTNGNWFVEVGDDHRRLGYWPPQLFTGLKDLAASAEWGGEVFSPPGHPTPAMGAGFIPTRPDTNYDAHIRQLTLIFEKKQTDALDVETFYDSDNYKSVDVGDVRKDFFNHLMFFGGSASPN